MKELQSILLKAYTYFANQKKCVLATIVKIEGSGYRRQGTRMLISENGEFTGAISGGCVEKEVWLQSASVFKNGRAKIMTYDGRYRLGCEGTLYILIEPIAIRDGILQDFQENYEARKPLLLQSFYYSGENQNRFCGTYISYDNKILSLNDVSAETGGLDKLECFEQSLKPTRKILIFGSEHDSVSLCKIAAFVGWDVTIVAHPLNEKKISFFPGAKELLHLLPEKIENLRFDQHTACILMSHSFSRDLSYLLELSNFKCAYIGLLGPHKRKNQLLDQLIEKKSEVSDEFLDKIYGPVGLDIGAERPDEIAIAILAELQTVFTETQIGHLRNKSGSIHERG